MIMDNIEYVLHHPFDVNTHKRTFIGELNVIIHDDGTVHYAVPSHRAYLAALYCKKKHIKHEWYIKQIVIEKNPTLPLYLNELCEATGSIAVWYDHTIGTMNAKQLHTLEMLRRHEVYGGEIDETTSAT